MTFGAPVDGEPYYVTALHYRKKNCDGLIGAFITTPRLPCSRYVVLRLVLV
jgi:hypothetical protein